jgi:DUF4097 and DUF4098 domain-containing protein YvlB
MKRYMAAAIVALVLGLLAAPASASEDARVIEKSFDIGPGGKLVLEVKIGGDIQVEPWDRDEVHIEARITGRHREDVDVKFDTGRSRLDVKVETEKRRNVNASCDLLVKVPREFDVEFETMGGDVQITGLKGEFSGTTMGGDLAFDGLEGRLEATTMGGDVVVERSKLDGKVKTMGGDVEIRDVTGDLKGSTMGGDVTYKDVRHTGKDSDDDDEVSISTFGGDLDLDYEGKNVKAKTMGGDVDVHRAEKVSVVTMGGDVDVDDAPSGASVTTMGGDITIGDAGEFVKAKTMGGDITVDAVDGWIAAETMGGDVNVTMVGNPGEGKRDIELKSMGGDIELTVPKGLSMEFDIEIKYTKNQKKKPRIISDFAVNVDEDEKWSSSWGQKHKKIYGTGSVNGGEHLVKIRTVNGDVIIREGK